MKWIILKSRAEFDAQLEHFNRELSLPNQHAQTYAEPIVASDGTVAFPLTPHHECLHDTSPLSDLPKFDWNSPQMLKFANQGAAIAGAKNFWQRNKLEIVACGITVLFLGFLFWAFYH